MSATRIRTIGILTGGGDVPGLNPCIKQLVLRASQAGIRVLGIRQGWNGLLAYDPDAPDAAAENIMLLDAAGVRTIDRSGGTILHTSRTNPASAQGQTGRMVALVQGCYQAIAMGDLKGGAKRVDVAHLYDTEEYRPDIRVAAGKPMFLY